MTFLPTDFGIGQANSGGIWGMPSGGGIGEGGGLLAAFRNPALLNVAASLLESSGPSRTPVSTGQALGRGLLAYQQGQDMESRRKLLEAQARKMQQDIEDAQAQRDFYKRAPNYLESPQAQVMGQFGGPTNEAAENLPSEEGLEPRFNTARMYRDMLSVPGLFEKGLEGMTKGSKMTWQVAGDKLVQLDERGNPTGKVIDARKNDIPWYVQTNEEGAPAGINPLFRELELAKATRSGGGTPYFMPVQTGQGVMSFNARTGRMEPVAVGGAPVVGAQYDPRLQGELSSAKSAGQFTGESTAKRELGSKRAIPVIDEAEKLLDDATGSYIGTARDVAGRVVGVSTKGSEATAKLKALEGNLMMAMPRMEGPQSDRDVALYRQMAGQIGDSTVPVATRKAALKTIRQLHQKYTGQADNTGGGWGIRRLP